MNHDWAIFPTLTLFIVGKHTSVYKPIISNTYARAKLTHIIFANSSEPAAPLANFPKLTHYKLFLYMYHKRSRIIPHIYTRLQYKTHNQLHTPSFEKASRLAHCPYHRHPLSHRLISPSTIHQPFSRHQTAS